MAAKRYYLSDNDYTYILRVFPTARNLSWFQPKEDGNGLCWYADIDFEDIPEEDQQILGEAYEACMERLKREVQTEPPVSSGEPDSSKPMPSLAIGRTKKKKRKGLRFIMSSALASVILIFMTAYHVHAPSEIKHTSRPHVNFMDLLQKSVKAVPTAEATRAQITEILNQCQNHLRAKRLTTGEGGTALNCYREVLRMDPNSLEAKAGIQNIEMQYLLWAQRALREENLEKVRQYVEGLEKVNPDSPDLTEFRQILEPEPDEEIEEDVAENSDPPAPVEDAETEIADVNPNIPQTETEETADRVADLLSQCQAHLRAKRLTTGKKGTAMSCYKDVLKLDPDNAEAQTGLQKMEMQYVLWAKRALRGRNLKKVRGYLEGLERVNPESEDLVKLKRQLTKREKPRAKKEKTPRSASLKQNKTHKKETEQLTQISLGIEN